MGTDDRPEIKPSPPRWQPNPDPDSIEVPGLDTSASVNDQIDQIEQLITLKLQVDFLSQTWLTALNTRVRTSMKTSPRYITFLPIEYYLRSSVTRSRQSQFEKLHKCVTNNLCPSSFTDLL